MRTFTSKTQHGTYLTPEGQTRLAEVMRGEATIEFDVCRVGSGEWTVTEVPGDPVEYTIEVPDNLASPVTGGTFQITRGAGITDNVTELESHLDLTKTAGQTPAGGFIVTEVEWLLSDGTVYAISNYAPMPVMPMSSGSPSDVAVRAHIISGDSGRVSITIDSSIGVTRLMLDDKVRQLYEEEVVPAQEAAALNGQALLAHKNADDPHDQYVLKSELGTAAKKNEGEGTGLDADLWRGMAPSELLSQTYGEILFDGEKAADTDDGIAGQVFHDVLTPDDGNGVFLVMAGSLARSQLRNVETHLVCIDWDLIQTAGASYQQQQQLCAGLGVGDDYISVYKNTDAPSGWSVLLWRYNLHIYKVIKVK